MRAYTVDAEQGVGAWGVWQSLFCMVVEEVLMMVSLEVFLRAEVAF